MTEVPNFAEITFERTEIVPPRSEAAPWLTPEGIPVKPAYGAGDLAGLDFLDTYPGIAPFP